MHVHPTLKAVHETLYLLVRCVFIELDDVAVAKPLEDIFFSGWPSRADQSGRGE